MIDEALVKHVARLARLQLTDAETAAMKRELGAILDTMEALKSVDVSAVPPTSHVLGLTDVLRPDEARPFAHREALLEGAPNRDGDYFKVPKVLE
ncbi:MAG: Asp-tRNA(Asn)/Glu-tRNA(Gln) amidotransferase subunit GatC [Elusimicrobia bacterium]|nr:Asp-tRNA(Asn)/Glu-tRNA(Gln) amidotransferase subunit GatC [Elusimicrobiota bacterium]